MKQLMKRNFYDVLFLVLLTAITAGSYFYFSSYEPKALKKVEEVKGAKRNADLIDYMYPEDAQKIGVNQTSTSTQVTFTTNKTLDQLENFYQVMLEDQDWELDSVKKEKDTSIIDFKKENKTLEVMSQKDDNSTVVSLNINSKSK